MGIYPKNTLANFFTKLPHQIYLNGEWEVGIAEIQYPYTWNNVNRGQNKIYVKTWNESEYTPIEIPPGNYNDIEKLIFALMERITMTRKFRADDLEIHYTPIDKRTSIFVKRGCFLRLEGDVATVLGFNQGTVINNTLVTSPHFALVVDAISSLYVYTDIIDSQYVGDVKVPLLRIVGVEGQHGHFITKTFDRPQYLPVCRQTLDAIEIDIKDDTGKHISFEYGKVVVKLHFRKQRPAYFA